MLITSVANGGNLILNVGPTGRGEFDARATKALDSLSIWMHSNKQSIYNCTYAPSTYAAPANTRLTYNAKNKRLYVHLFEYPTDGVLNLVGYAGKVKYVQFLHDASELLFNQSEGSANDVRVKLPTRKPNYEIPVVEIVLQ